MYYMDKKETALKSILYEQPKIIRTSSNHNSAYSWWNFSLSAKLWKWTIYSLWISVVETSTRRMYFCLDFDWSFVCLYTNATLKIACNALKWCALPQHVCSHTLMRREHFSQPISASLLYAFFISFNTDSRHTRYTSYYTTPPHIF